MCSTFPTLSISGLALKIIWNHFKPFLFACIFGGFCHSRNSGLDISVGITAQKSFEASILVSVVAAFTILFDTIYLCEAVFYSHKTPPKLLEWLGEDIPSQSPGLRDLYYDERQFYENTEDSFFRPHTEPQTQGDHIRYGGSRSGTDGAYVPPMPIPIHGHSPNNTNSGHARLLLQQHMAAFRPSESSGTGL